MASPRVVPALDALSAVGKALDKRRVSLYNHINNKTQGWS